MKMMIDTIQKAIEIPYIGENHAEFANYTLGSLQHLIKESIKNNQDGIPFERIAKVIVDAHEYASEHRRPVGEQA